VYFLIQYISLSSESKICYSVIIAFCCILARLNCFLLIKKKVNKNDVSISRAHHPIRVVNSESQNYVQHNNNNKAHMLQFTCTMPLCITIRDNFSGQKDVCSDGCIVFIVEEPSNRNYSQCDIENSIGVRERIIIL